LIVVSSATMSLLLCIAAEMHHLLPDNLCSIEGMSANGAAAAGDGAFVASPFMPAAGEAALRAAAVSSAAFQ
jgi:hypothetical protein